MESSPEHTAAPRGGEYIVEETLGSGATATVLAVRHPAHAMPLAMKILSAAHAGSPQFRARFLREGVTARALSSEHVVRILDTGVLETGQPYLVMERLFGTDLDALLEQRGPLPLAFVVEVALQASSALAEAHAAGIVHRDLKPANLFLARQPDGNSIIKVVDFGISKNAVLLGPALTQATAALGTPSYMAPEQFLSPKTVDQRADIWSLGVTLFELLTGSLPFQGPTLGALAASILYDSPRKVSELRPELPGAISSIIARCLSKDLAKRYASIHDLARDLGDLAQLLSAPAWEDEEKTTVYTPREASHRERPGFVSRALVLTIGVLLILAIATLLLAFHANWIRW